MPSYQSSEPVPGTSDLLAGDISLLRDLAHRLQRFLEGHGYALVDVPVLERTELYLRKLGSQVAALMFTLADQRGERLSLRPEYTGSIIRSYLHHAGALATPVRWQYCGPVFRDHIQASQQPRQFTQLGVELIGAAGSAADAELLALAVQGLEAQALPAPQLVIGHAGLVAGLLRSFQLSERVRLHLAGHVELLRQGPTGRERLRQSLLELCSGEAERSPVQGLALDQLEAGEAAALLGRLLREGTVRPTGRRTSEEILRRFQAKLHSADNPEHLEQALSLVAELATVCAAPEVALAQGRKIIQRFRLDSEPLAELEAACTLLQAFPLEPQAIRIDLGLTRPLGYYTGIVFEMRAGLGEGRLVGGGGRYDGLVRALGGPQEVPALGFAYTLEHLAGLLRETGTVAATAGEHALLVVPAEAADFPRAVRYAADQRARGRPAILEVVARSEEARQRYCRAAGISLIALVGATAATETPVAEEAKPYAAAGAS
ncbi:MAG: ATP phosphoribosyltransferase regulatory subunit [Chloroflexi bacterium]|nr:ATP phosphoribosyltransferase regulatory subunit [Chloroflexota bacterium]